MEEYFEDPSFIYYLIDNVERAMNNSQEDLDKFVDKIKDKTIKKYVKTLKSDLNNQNSLSLLKKLTSVFSANLQKPSVSIPKVDPIIQEVDERSKVSNKLKTLDQLKREEFPSPFEQTESKNFKLI